MLRFRTDCAREHTGKCGCIDTNGLTVKSTSHQPPHVADKCIVGNVTLQLRILLATGRLAWKYTGRIVSTLYGSISPGLTEMTFRSIRKGNFRPSLPDGRSRSRSSNRPIGSWNLRPRKVRSAIQTALLRRIEILSANVVRLKHLELIARGP